MQQNEIDLSIQSSEITNNLVDIKLCLENLSKASIDESNRKNLEISLLKEELDNLHYLIDGNQQLINKLLGDISKLQNDVEWYKKTYVQRSFLGTILEKIFRK